MKQVLPADVKNNRSDCERCDLERPAQPVAAAPTREVIFVMNFRRCILLSYRTATRKLSRKERFSPTFTQVPSQMPPRRRTGTKVEADSAVVAAIAQAEIVRGE